jgi:hypothetical protein
MAAKGGTFPRAATILVTSLVSASHRDDPLTKPSATMSNPAPVTPAPTSSPTATGGSSSGSGSGSGSGSSSGSVLSIPQTAAAGGLTITQPPQTTVSFFKIAPSQEVTIAWNFTSLFSTPSHLTVSAICENGNTYPIGPTDGILPGTATSVVWDPFSYNQANPNTPLAQATYTLSIWDDRGRNPARAPGLFQPNNALTFALYKPQSYTPLASGTSPAVQACIKN